MAYVNINALANKTFQEEERKKKNAAKTQQTQKTTSSDDLRSRTVSMNRKRADEDASYAPAGVSREHYDKLRDGSYTTAVSKSTKEKAATPSLIPLPIPNMQTTPTPLPTPTPQPTPIPTVTSKNDTKTFAEDHAIRKKKIEARANLQDTSISGLKAVLENRSIPASFMLKTSPAKEWTIPNYDVLKSQVKEEMKEYSDKYAAAEINPQLKPEYTIEQRKQDMEDSARKYEDAEARLNQLKEEQLDPKTYEKALLDPDYSILSSYGSKKDSKVNRAFENRSILLDEDKTSGNDDAKYLTMNVQELALYNYFIGAGLSSTAEDYLSALEPELNKRLGTIYAKHIEEIENPVVKFGAVTGHSIKSGVESGVSGLENFYNSYIALNDAVPVQSPGQTTHVLNMQNADGFTRFVGDLGYSAGNMAPAVAAGFIPYVGPALSVGITGASSAGNAYADARREGKTDEEAKKYGALEGVKEAGMQYLLGGITKLGGKFGASKLLSKLPGVSKSKKIISNVVDKLAKNPSVTAAFKASEKYVANGLDEGFEEYLQTILDPAIRNVAFDENNDIEFFTEEALYSAALGAASAGIFNIGDIPSNYRNAKTDVQNKAKPLPVPAKGIFDKNIGTKNNFATQADVDNYVDYAYRYAEEQNIKGNKDFPNQKDSIVIGKASERLVSDLNSGYGIDVSDAVHVIRDNDIRHIKNSHGEGTNEKYPITANDLKRIPDIVENYDDVLFVSRPDGKKGLYYVKRHNGVTYYLESIGSSGKILQNKQMIKVSTGTIPYIKELRDAINKKWNIDSYPDDASIPRMYVQDVPNNVPTTTIPQPEQSVNLQPLPTFPVSDETLARAPESNPLPIDEDAPVTQFHSPELMENNDAASVDISNAPERNIPLPSDNDVQPLPIAQNTTQPQPLPVAVSMPKKLKEMHDKIDNYANKRGLRVLWYNDLMRPDRADENGFYENGVIYINENAENPYMEVFKHELFHSLGADVKLKVASFFQKHVDQSSQKFIDYKNSVMDAYKKKDGTFDETAFWEEYAAQNAEILLNENVIDKIARTDRNLAQRILDVIKQALADFKSIFSSPKDYSTLRNRHDGLNVSGLSDAQLQKAARLYEKALRKSDTQNDAAHSIKNIIGKKGNYGIGVYLDTNIFDGYKPRRWNEILSDFVYNNLAGTDIVVYDESGNAETISFAKANERVQKDGAKHPHKVIDKLARTNGNVQMLSVVHIGELLQTAKQENTNTDNVHKWLDDGGWEHRKTYVQDRNNNVYEATLNIANARDGRRILYSISNVKKVDEGAVSSAQTGGTRSLTVNSKNNIPQTPPGVKPQNSLKHSVIFGDSPAAAENVAPVNNNAVSEMPKNTKLPVSQNGYLSLEFDEQNETSSDSLLGWVNDKVRERNEAYARTAEASQNMNVASGTEKNKPGIKKQASELSNEFRRKFVDAGASVQDFAKVTGDKHLYAFYNNAKQAQAAGQHQITKAQTDLKGNKVGKSLDEIFNPILSQGIEYVKDFDEYLLQRHNIDRIRAGKPITFTEDLSAYMRTSREMVETLSRQHPEFEAMAEDVYAYLRNMMQMRVDAGLITKQEADYMQELYPHYVPTHRKMGENYFPLDTIGEENVFIGTGIKRALGSDLNILLMYEQISKMTMQTVSQAKRNIFANRLVDLIYNDPMKAASFAQVPKDYDGMFGLDDLKGEMLNGNMLVYHRNGKTEALQLSNEMVEAIKDLTAQNKEHGKFYNGARKVNSVYKSLITEYSLPFTIRNIMRDFPDALFASKDTAAFLRYLPEAMKDMKNNGELWQQFEALGGTASSLFDYDYSSGTFKESSWLKKNTLGRISELNRFVEMIPRFAEFYATVKKGDGGYANLMDAMHNAADVTVNFQRGGSWIKPVNATFVPFLNASIQGASKNLRIFTEAKGAKQWLRLAIKASLFGLLPSVLNELILGDDEDYKELHSYDKMDNYIFKIPNTNKFIKIPGGRLTKSIGTFGAEVVKLLRGDETDFVAVGKNALSQLGPLNPMQSNLLAPVDNVIDNKTWYGGEIENSRLQALPVAERYDTDTSEIGKFVGKTFNVSPKKVDYLIDSYTGILGDTVLPIFTNPDGDSVPFKDKAAGVTKKAFVDPLAKKFYIDGEMSNETSSKFYNKIDEVTQMANGQNGSKSDELTLKYLNSQKKKLGDLYAGIRAIESDTSISYAQRQEEARELQSEINRIQREALANVDKYSETIKKYSGKDEEVAYFLANRDVLGLDYAIESMTNDSRAKKMKSFTDAGISVEKSFDIMNAFKKFESDTGDWGRSISGSKNKKSVEYIEGLKLNSKQKAAVYKAYMFSDVDERYDFLANQIGIADDVLGNIYGKLSTIESSKDSQGKTISGSQNRNVYNYINTLSLSGEQRRLLFAWFASSTNEQKKQRYNVINNLNIPQGDKETVLQWLQGNKTISDAHIKKIFNRVKKQ